MTPHNLQTLVVPHCTSPMSLIIFIIFTIFIVITSEAAEASSTPPPERNLFQMWESASLALHFMCRTVVVLSHFPSISLPGGSTARFGGSSRERHQLTHLQSERGEEEELSSYRDFAPFSAITQNLSIQLGHASMLL